MENNDVVNWEREGDKEFKNIKANLNHQNKILF